MTLTMTPERDSASVYRLLRCLLLGLIAAGIIGMHVLSAQAGGGHGMVMDPQAAPTMTAQPAPTAGSHSRHGEMTLLSAASIAKVAPAVAPVDTGLPGSMAMCLLFLAGGGVAIALLQLAARRWQRTPGPAGGSTPSWEFTGRGPPWSAVSLHSLCILRV